MKNKYFLKWELSVLMTLKVKTRLLNYCSKSFIAKITTTNVSIVFQK